MSVLERDALEASPLADLHAIASELSIDGFRRLRKADLIDAIVARQSGTAAEEEPTVDAASASTEEDVDSEEESTAAGRRRRGRRGGRGRAAREAGEDAVTDEDAEDEDADRPAPRRASGRSDRTKDRDADKETAEKADRSDAGAKARRSETVEGVVELLANGSGFVRVNGSEPSDDDVYISAAQVKRCELVSGDTVSGPRRAPQRSERFASLVRVDTINGRPASEVADGARYEDLAATLPTERFKFGSEDETVKAIEFLTPLGRGSRVTVVGGAWAGKSHTLRALAHAFSAIEDVTVFVALAGVRPEELGEWSEVEGLPEPAASLSFSASADAQDHAVELVVDQARRLATRGGHAVVLVDTLDGLHPHAARKVLAAARNLTQGGSLTVVATAAAPLGGETTVISLDAALTATHRFPAVDLARSGTLAAERLVGDAGAKAIAEARTEALAAV
jgi:transcription termination factor Rho